MIGPLSLPQEITRILRLYPYPPQPPLVPEQVVPMNVKAS